MKSSNEATTDSNASQPSSQEQKPRSGRARWTKALIILRRIHLYAGLFLLPWVFLYGITGAMYNHRWFLPDVNIQHFGAEQLAKTNISNFPAPAALAEQVAAELSSTSGQSIAVDPEYSPEYSNDMMFQTVVDGQKYVVAINPTTHTSSLTRLPADDIKPKKILRDIKNITLETNPLAAQRDTAQAVIDAGGLSGASEPKPHAYIKLNFVATVDDQPARITYVLRDGHVEANEFDGSHGMTWRGFLMRLHTTHGQGPHWNGRLFWTIILDAMAVAMVVWGATGLVMWWQIKRTRKIGAVVIAASIAVAVFLYFSVSNFYATTVL